MERTTHDMAAVPLFGRYDTRPPMPADIVECAKLTRVASDHHGPFTGHVECQVITRVWQIG